MRQAEGGIHMQNLIIETVINSEWTRETIKAIPEYTYRIGEKIDWNGYEWEIIGMNDFTCGLDADMAEAEERYELEI